MPSHDPMDAALPRVMRAAQANPAGCDRELAAAYVERRLRPAERQSFEAHLAACAACRALVVTLAQEFLPEAAELPDAIAAPRHWWSWRWWNWKWLVPAMAGVVLVASAVLYQREQLLRRTAPISQPVTQNKAIAEAPPPAPPAATTAPPAATTALQRRVRRTDELKKVPLPAGEPAPSIALKDKEVAATKRKVLALRPVSGEAGREEARQEAAAPAVAGAVVISPAPPAAAPAANAVKARDSAAISSVVLNERSFSPLPNGAPLRHYVQRDDRVWAVSDGGRIFRSTDAGRTWTKLASPTTADLVKVEWESETSLVVVDKEGNRYRLRP